MKEIKYTVNGTTHNLTQDEFGNWVESLAAPQIAGDYPYTIQLNNDGLVTYIDSSTTSHPNLMVRSEIPEVDISQYLPERISKILEFHSFLKAENQELSTLWSNTYYSLDQMFIGTASPSTVLRLENFLGVKGEGTLDQRKSFILALLKKSSKLSEASIKSVVHTITGSDALVKFFPEDDPNNPHPGTALIYVQVLSPDPYKDYKYDDIQRVLDPLIPAHITLMVVRYFATWQSIMDNYSSWLSVSETKDWAEVKAYIPPNPGIIYNA